MGMFYGCFYTLVRAEGAAKTAAGELAEKQDRAQKKAFFQS